MLLARIPAATNAGVGPLFVSDPLLARSAFLDRVRKTLGSETPPAPAPDALIGCPERAVGIGLRTRWRRDCSTPQCERGSASAGGRFAPTPAVWSTAPTLLLFCLQAHESRLTAGVTGRAPRSSLDNGVRVDRSVASSVTSWKFGATKRCHRGMPRKTQNPTCTGGARGFEDAARRRRRRLDCRRTSDSGHSSVDCLAVERVECRAAACVSAAEWPARLARPGRTLTAVAGRRHRSDFWRR